MTHFTRMYDPVDPRMGRHVNHDPRAAAYALPVRPRSAIQSVHWSRAVGVFDQGQLGSCTGNAGTGILGTSSVTGSGATSVTISPAGARASHGIFAAETYGVNEDFAVRLYELATRIDPFPGSYPPTDTGSDGPSVAAALKLLGLATGYDHAFSVDAAKAAVQSGPLMWGTEWLNSMFTPGPGGHLVVDPSSGVVGGHELVISGYDPASDTWAVDNSWGPSWGNYGSCLVSGPDMAYLLSRDGDITVPVLAAVPPPVPPAPPAPVVGDRDLWAASKAWAAAKGFN